MASAASSRLRSLATATCPGERIATMLRLAPRVTAGLTGLHLGACALYPDSGYARMAMGRHQCALLPPDHPLSVRARDIAERMGVSAPGSVRVAVDPGARDPYASGSFLPTRLWRSRGEKSVLVTVPPHYLEDAAEYGAVQVDGRDVDPAVVLPSEREKTFAIAHELSHVKHEDILFHAVVSPAAMFAFLSAGQSRGVTRAVWRLLRSPRAPLHALVGATACMGVGAILISWSQEVMADTEAALNGYAAEGECAMTRLRNFNRLARDINHNRFITDDGDYLLDVMHPSLSTRQRLIHYVSQHTQ